jgi:hypothetical protein
MNKSTKILAVVLLAVIAVAAFIGVYYFVLPNQQAQKPTVVTNFSDGAWANFSLSIYNANGTLASIGRMAARSSSGTINGSDCWVYIENTTYTSSDGSIVTDAVTDYLDKSTYATLKKTEVVTSNGAVIYDQSFSPQDAGFIDTIATVRNFTVTGTGESVTVPAGTFSATVRQGQITYASDPTTYDFTSWTSSQVSGWGVVKYQFHVGGALFSEYLLDSYGS